MSKLNSLLLIAGFTVCGQSLAMVNCNGISTVMCMRLTGSTQGHYLKIKMGNMTSPAICMSSLSEDAVGGPEKEDMDEALAYHFMRLGQNTFQFIQCNNEACQYPKIIGDYRFNLSKSTNGDYQATPDHYAVTITDFGDTCTVNPNPMMFSHF